MPSITALLSESFDRLDGRWRFAAIPAAVALISAGKAFRSASVDFHVGVKFAFPIPVTTGWAFLSLPSAGVGGSLPSRDPAVAVPLLALSAVVSAILAAGYLGGIARALDGRDGAFLVDVRRYSGPLLAFQLLVFAGALLALGAFLIAAPLLVVVLPALLVGAYLLYPVQFLVILERLGFVPALRRSVALTTDGGDVLWYFLQYVLAAAAVSVPSTLVFVNLGPIGLLVGAVALAPVALLFDTATMAFLRESIDPDLVPAIRRID